MPTHHPMDRLHAALAQIDKHPGAVQDEAERAVTDWLEQHRQEQAQTEGTDAR